jgi:predicted membrane chloride channel (bestrophin family)
VLSLPFVLASLTPNVSTLLVFCVIEPLLFVSLLEVAEELEDPYGEE